MTNNLHVYGQEFPHDQVKIIGDKETLLALIDQINLAIASQEVENLYFTNDGEGFNLSVACVDEKEFQKASLPYMDEIWGKNDYT